MAMTSAGSFDATGTSFEAAQPIFDYLAEANAQTYAYNSAEAAAQRIWQQDMYAQEMAFNSSEAARNRDWQEMMSNTAHQREVRDLIAAGLNPVLSVNGGNGASVGSGASAMVSGTPSGAKASADNVNSQVISLLGGLIDQQTKLMQMQVSAQAASSAVNLAELKRQWELDDREYEEDWYKRKSAIDMLTDVVAANAKPGTGMFGGLAQSVKNLLGSYSDGTQMPNVESYYDMLMSVGKGSGFGSASGTSGGGTAAAGSGIGRTAVSPSIKYHSRSKSSTGTTSSSGNTSRYKVKQTHR